MFHREKDVLRTLLNLKRRDAANQDIHSKYLDTLKEYIKLLHSETAEFMTYNLEQIEEAIDTSSL